MDRRSFLATASAFAAASAAAPGQAAPRFATPGGRDWPSDRAWSGLKRSLDGDLLTPQPLWDACETDAKACGAQLTRFRNPFALGDDPAGTQVFGYLDAWRTAPSAYAVAAESAQDVARAIDFARRRRVRLVVRGGGHSYLGGSNAADSLLVWTRRLRRVQLHEDFQAKGGSRLGPAVSLGAGAMWIDAYDAVTTQAGRYVQGGGCTTVGVAGLVQGGGFGSFSKGFGLAAGSLLEAELVTADGRIRTVNAQNDPELFWALKGGGGGTFGVMTRLTLATHPLPNWMGGCGGRLRAQTETAYRTAVDAFLKHYRQRLLNPHWGEQVKFKPGHEIEISMVAQGLTTARMEDDWKAFVAWTATQPELQWIEPFGASAREARGWWDAAGRKARGSTAFRYDDRPSAPPHHAWWADDGQQVGAFLHEYESAWLNAGLLDDARRPGLADAIVSASQIAEVAFHFNKGLAGAPPEAIARARDTAMNPQVCDAFCLAIIAGGGPPPFAAFRFADLSTPRANAQRIRQSMARLRQVAPEAGSYLSESSYFSPDWAQRFWGSHAATLMAIKRRVDPQGQFQVHHGVGDPAA